jgi:plastocyanin
MASLSSATVTAPSFAAARPARATRRSPVVVCASLKAVGTAAVSVASSALLVSGAMAQEVLLGTTGGVLVFEPSDFIVKVSDTITFKNNTVFPHNVVFNEAKVPNEVNSARSSSPPCA